MSIGSEVLVIEPMFEHHLSSGAVAIAAMTRTPAEVAEKYGVVPANPDDEILEFVEKPTLAELHEHFAVHETEEFDRLPLLTNAGFFPVDSGVRREVAGHPDVAAMRRYR
jgi:NDP-sugar pyrophosphorylase family protein